MPTMNFVTNIAGAMIVGEAIKLLTETGKVCRFPKVVDLDLYNNKMSAKKLYSPLRAETFKKIFAKRKDKDRFRSLIDHAKRKAGAL